MQEGTAALAGYGRIFRETVALTGVVPADLGRLRRLGRRRRLLARADRPDPDDRGRRDVPDRPGRRARGARRGDRRRRARRPAGPRPQRRLPPGRARRGAAPPRACASCSATCRRRPVDAAAAWRRPVGPELSDPGAVRAAGAAPRLRRARRARAGSSTRGSLLELCPRWARNVVTALARIDGRPVGIVANQPRYLGGVLDAEGSEKAARFVGFCDSFGLPLIAVVDTPGFMPGSRQEQAGVIRHGASLVRAFAAARVPEAHRRPAQVLRRRVHHDELARPRRRPRAGLARRRARDHERARRGRDRQPPRAARRRRPRGRARRGSPTPTPTSTCAPRRPPPRASSTRSSSRRDTRDAARRARSCDARGVAPT